MNIQNSHFAFSFSTFLFNPNNFNLRYCAFHKFQAPIINKNDFFPKYQFKNLANAQEDTSLISNISFQSINEFYVYEPSFCLVMNNCIFYDININGPNVRDYVLQIYGAKPLYMTECNFVNCSSYGTVCKLATKGTIISHVCMTECFSYKQYSCVHFDFSSKSFAKVVFSTFASNGCDLSYVETIGEFFFQSGSYMLKCNNITKFKNAKYTLDVNDALCFIFMMNSLFQSNDIQTIINYGSQTDCLSRFSRNDFIGNVFLLSFFSLTRSIENIYFENCTFTNNYILSGTKECIIFESNDNYLTFINCFFDYPPCDSSYNRFVNCTVNKNNELLQFLNNNAHYVNEYCIGNKIITAYQCNENDCLDPDYGAQKFFVHDSEDVTFTLIHHPDINSPTPPITSQFSFSKYFTKSDFFTHSSFFSNSNEFSHSNYFSNSDEFTDSNLFSNSNEFTNSKLFPNSNEFTNSKLFSNSDEFTDSKLFSNSNKFTHSNHFSNSNQFTNSKLFSNSNEFTNSKLFPNSDEFTHSNHLSDSNEFGHSSCFSDSNKFFPSNFFSGSNEFTHSNIQSIAFIIPTFSYSINFINSYKFSQSNLFTNTDIFTESKIYSCSIIFSKSNIVSSNSKFIKTQDYSHLIVFTQSIYFTRSNHFTETNIFSKSSSFTISKTFHSSSYFTQSNSFTSSDTFTSSNAFTDSKSFNSIYQLLETSRISISLSLMESLVAYKSVSFSLIESQSFLYTQMLLSNGEYSISLTQVFLPQYIPYLIQFLSPTYIPFEIVIELNVTKKKITQEQLIGIVCGTAAIFFCVTGIIILIIRKKNSANISFDEDIYSSGSEQEIMETNGNINTDSKYLGSFSELLM